MTETKTEDIKGLEVTNGTHLAGTSAAHYANLLSAANLEAQVVDYVLSSNRI